MKPQLIERNARPEWAIIRYSEYERLMALVEGLEDLRAYGQAKAELVRRGFRPACCGLAARILNVLGER